MLFFYVRIFYHIRQITYNMNNNLSSSFEARSVATSVDARVKTWLTKLVSTPTLCHSSTQNFASLIFLHTRLVIQLLYVLCIFRLPYQMLH